MTENNSNQKKDNQEGESVDFHGAAVLDENGNEIEITESMVRKAIHDLEPEAYPEIDENEQDS